jgi:hypothetical protein
MRASATVVQAGVQAQARPCSYQKTTLLGPRHWPHHPPPSRKVWAFSLFVIAELGGPGPWEKGVWSRIANGLVVA